MRQPRDRRQLLWLVRIASGVLMGLILTGLFVERTSRTPLVHIGQQAPDFTLPSSDGRTVTLSALRGRPVLVAFVPSVRCDDCRSQLLALQTVLPEAQARGIALLALSVDTAAVQRATAQQLGLAYTLLSEAPTVGQHPAGTAYGVYHRDQHRPGPVYDNALVVIDAGGVIRAVLVSPNQPIPLAEIRALLTTGLGQGQRG